MSEFIKTLFEEKEKLDEICHLEYCNFMKQIKICGFSFIKNDVN